MEKFSLLNDTPTITDSKTFANSSCGYVRIIEQTHEEKVAMYMKCKKKELIEMLIACNEAIDRFGMRIEFDYTKDKQL